jgi:hypothetical protein
MLDSGNTLDAQRQIMLDDARYVFERFYRPGFRDDQCAALATIFNRNFPAVIEHYQIDVAALLRSWRDELAAALPAKTDTATARIRPDFAEKVPDTAIDWSGRSANDTATSTARMAP